MAVTLVKDVPGFLSIDDDATLDFGDVDFSWFVWTRPQNLTLNHWISKGTPDEEDSNYHLFDDSVWKSGISASDGNPANDTISNDGPGANIDQWHHAGGDHDGGANDIDVYEDGVGAVSGRKADVAAPVANALDLDLGKLGTQATDGNMAWATIWRKRLSQEQLDAMKNGVNPFAIEPDTKELLMPLTGFGGGLIETWGLNKDQPIENFETYTTQAEADANWPTTDTTNCRVDIGSNRLEMFAVQSNNNRSVGFDIGCELSPKFVLRFKLNLVLVEHDGSVVFHVGLSTEDQNTNLARQFGGNEIGALYFRFRASTAGFGIDYSTRLEARQGQAGFTQIKTLKNETLGVSENRNLWVQFKYNEPKWTTTYYSDSSYTTVFANNSMVLNIDPSFMRNLKFFVGSNRYQTGFSDPNDMTHNVDDIELWNGVDEVPSGDFVREPDWSSKRNHADPHCITKFRGNPPVELIENYLS